MESKNSRAPVRDKLTKIWRPFHVYLLFSPFFKDWINVRLRLCYCCSALCLTMIQTWRTVVVTGKDDNSSGFSECEIRDHVVVSRACLPTGHSRKQKRSGMIDTALV